jgi:hypothetical protein
MSLPPVPHTTAFQDSKTGKISQPWLQWLELLRQEAITTSDQGTVSHSDLTGVTADQHHAEVHTHASSTAISHLDLSVVTANQHHAQSHIHDGVDGSGLVEYFGSVVSETSYGQAASNGALGTISRSDHTHGTPVASGVTEVVRAQYRQKEGLTWSTRWYVPYQRTHDISGVSFVLNRLYAIPFNSGNIATITGIGLFKQDAVNSNYRIGIYNNIANNDLYPSSLVGQVELTPGASSGFKSTVASLSLTANTLYWIVGCASSTSSLGGCGIGNTDFGQFAGYDPSDISLRPAGYVRAVFTYASLPDPFPAGGIIPLGIVDASMYTFFLKSG